MISSLINFREQEEKEAAKKKNAAGLSFNIRKILGNALPFEHAKPSLNREKVKANVKEVDKGLAVRDESTCYNIA